MQIIYNKWHVFSLHFKFIKDTFCLPYTYMNCFRKFVHTGRRHHKFVRLMTGRMVQVPSDQNWTPKSSYNCCFLLTLNVKISILIAHPDICRSYTTFVLLHVLSAIYTSINISIRVWLYQYYNRSFQRNRHEQYWNAKTIWRFYKEILQR